MTPAVFLDSGIFIAFLNERDQWHLQAVELFGRGARWCTSLLVVSECYSWFLHRHGEEAARQFRHFTADLDKLTLLDVSLDHHARTLKMLDRFRGSKLTYVDASSLVLIEQRKIKTVWSTDHHLALTGAEILPRS